jgi:hypothetical protein
MPPSSLWLAVTCSAVDVQGRRECAGVIRLDKPDLPVSKAVTASSAFPPFLSPLAPAPPEGVSPTGRASPQERGASLTRLRSKNAFCCRMAASTIIAGSSQLSSACSYPC